MQRKSGRPQGARNARPTKRELATYVNLLRDSADAGDVQAATALVNLHASEQLAANLKPTGG